MATTYISQAPSVGSRAWLMQVGDGDTTLDLSVFATAQRGATAGVGSPGVASVVPDICVPTVYVRLDAAASGPVTLDTISTGLGGYDYFAGGAWSIASADFPLGATLRLLFDSTSPYAITLAKSGGNILMSNPAVLSDVAALVLVWSGTAWTRV